MVRIKNFDEAYRRLKDGEIGIFPTDTAYGIGCRIDRDDLVEKIFEIRQRPKEKAVIALVSSIEMLIHYVQIPDNAKNLMDKYWPGGVTLILPCLKEKVPDIVRGGGETLAVRMPDHRKLINLIEKVGIPIIAPSANFSGMNTPLELNELDEELCSKVDFVLEGECTIKGVSTIIDASNPNLKIIREGVVDVKLQ